MDAHTTMSKKFFNFALIIFVIAFTFAGPSGNLLAGEAASESATTEMTNTADFSGIDALIAKAAKYGSVRVIVGFDVQFQPEGTLLSKAQVENQRLSIDLSQDIVLNSLASHDVRHVTRFDYIPYMAMEVDEEALDVLWSNPNIISIQEDVPVPPTLSDSVPLINADDLQSIGIDGSGVAVAVLDTGVRAKHKFLDQGKVVSEACYSTTGSGSTSVCPNGLEEQIGPGAGKNCNPGTFGCDHGTHVAGIVAGKGGADGLKGVAKGADIIAIQVFSEFGIFDCFPMTSCALSWNTDQIKGLERVYALRATYNIAAVNMSLGGGRFTSNCDTDSRKAMIDNLRSEGIATVISSGNDGFTNAMGRPACISSAVSVGATKKNDKVAGFSNSASFLDLLAPGVAIRSSVPPNAYASWNGTSMAAPHVAGAFALLKQAYPAASVSDILTSLKDTGVDVLDARNGITKPRIDVLAAMLGPGFPKPEITTPVPGTTISTSSVTFNWIANGLPVAKWDLWVGTTQGGNQVFDSDNLSDDTTSQLVDCIPLTGATVHVRLRFKVGGKWFYADFQYNTTSSGTPAITSPLPGTLSDNKVKFQWNAGNLCKVQGWRLYVGTSPGANNLYDSGKLPGTDIAHTVKRLPYDGSNIYVRLRYKAYGIWQYIDVIYKAATWNIGITNPAPDSKFSSRSVTFIWVDSGDKVKKWRLLVGSGTGKNDYYDSGNLGAGTLETTATKLPKDGRKVYVRLKFKINGLWEYIDYQYTAVDELPKITNPVPGSTLNSSSVTFQWTPETYMVQKWRLYLGSAKGMNDYYDSGALNKNILSDTCDVVPTDGSKIHVRLKYKTGGKWKYRDYTYTAANKIPGIYNPSNGSQLTTTKQVFMWQLNNAYVRNFKLWVGSSPGGKDIYDSGTLPNIATSDEATGLPFDGSTIYVQLRYKSGVKWMAVDYVYTVKDNAPDMVSPAPGSILGSSRVTFQWDSGNVSVQYFSLRVGKTPGGNEKHDSGKLDETTLSHEVRKLPINGSTLYVRLRYKVNGIWYYRDYVYTAVTWDVFEIYNPEPKSKLRDTTQTFYWRDNGAPVDQWRLKVGTSKGSDNKYKSAWLSAATTSRTVNGLPKSGNKIYVRLEAKFNDDVFYKDYWYLDAGPTHRFYNRLTCNGKSFTAKVTMCGETLTSKTGKWSECESTKAGSCAATIYAKTECGIIQDSGNFTLKKGCHNDWVLELDFFGFWIVRQYTTCPGDCDTPKPSLSEMLSDPDAADSIKVIMKGTVEGGAGFDTLE